MTSFQLLTCYLIFISSCATTESRAKLDHLSRSELAQEHYQRVLTQVMCGIPRPRLFRMETDELRVLPPATLIHRCGDRSGCCDSILERCVAKTKKKVRLYFFVKPRSTKGNGKKHKVRKYTFTNHTECHCVDKRDIPR